MSKKKHLKKSSSAEKSQQTRENCKSEPKKTSREHINLLSIYYRIFMPVLLCVILYFSLFGILDVNVIHRDLIIILILTPLLPVIKKFKLPFDIKLKE